MVAAPHHAIGETVPIGRPDGFGPARTPRRALTVLRGGAEADDERVEAKPVRALLCDASGMLLSERGTPGRAEVAAAIGRARSAGLLVAVIRDGWPTDGGDDLIAAIGPVDLVAVPGARERTTGRPDEVRPRFVQRTCCRLGVEPASCAVVGGRRALLAAAAWAGARTVMVPNDATPLFDLRGQRHVAPDFPAAIAVLLEPEGGS